MIWRFSCGQPYKASSLQVGREWALRLLAAAGAAIHRRSGITEQLDRTVNSRPCGETVCLGCAWIHGRTTATCNYRQTSGTVRVSLKAKRDAVVFARHRSNQRQARCCTSHPPIRAGQSAQLLQGKLGLGCKPDVLGSACLLPTRIVFGPDFRQVQLPSHRPACRSAWPSFLARCPMNCSNFLDKSIMLLGRIRNVHITSYFMTQ